MVSKRISVPSCWESGRFRLFLSHLSDGREYARSLKIALNHYRICAFVAHEDIAVTEPWEEEILLALNTCDALVALLHEGFHGSDWTDQEVGAAVGLNKVAVAVRLGMEPYGFIARLQAFHGVGKPIDVLAKEIFDAFVANKNTKASMAEALLVGFEQTSSFSQGKQRIALLEQVTHWGEDFSNRVETALLTNNQFVDNVPERARKLIEGWNVRSK